jgi:hypothetical protein
MTPKEKAEELVDQFYKITTHEQRAIECAMVTIKEVLMKARYWAPEHTIEFWEDCKKELEIKMK